MMEQNRIVLSGAGGQGVITAAIILAEAAVLHEGLNAVQSQLTPHIKSGKLATLSNRPVTGSDPESPVL